MSLVAKDHPTRFRIGLLLVGACAFAVRAIHLGATIDSPLGGLLILDSRQYHLEALRILGMAAETESSGVSFMNVGYPYLLAAAYALFGRSVSAVLWLQALLDTGTAVLLALSARRLYEQESAALLAGLLYAFYAPAVFYDGLLLTPATINALLAGVLWLVSAPGGGCRGLLLLLLAGVGVGLAGVLRPSNLLLAVALVPPLLLGGRRDGAARLLRSAAPALGAALVVLPIVVHNGVAHGQWVPLSANGGMNFWVGNNENARGLYHPAEFLDDQDLQAEQLLYLEEARRRSGDGALTLADSSRFWFGEALRDIRSDPRRWLLLEVGKLGLFWNHAEAKTNVSIGIIERFSPVLSRATLGFGTIGLVGLAGLAYLAVAGRRRAALLLSCWTCVPLLTCLLFFVSGEYRHPASLALCVAAAACARGVVQRDYRSLAAASLVALLAAPLVVRQASAIEFGSHPHTDLWNYSRALLAEETPDREALERKHRRVAALLDPAVTGADDSPVLDEARFHARFRAAIELGDREAAARALEGARRFLARDPRIAERDAFAAYLLRSVPQRIAELAGQESVRSDPTLRREAALMGANGYREVADMLAREEREAARAFLTEAIRRSPHNVVLQAELGRLLLVLGRDAEGLGWLERSCNGYPLIPECAFYAADYYARRGDRGRAEAALREALHRRPGFPPAVALRDRLASTP